MDSTKNSKSKWEVALIDQIANSDLPRPELEYKFHPSRRFRFDIAYPEYMVAIEVEGGSWGKPVVCHNCGTVVKERKRNGGMIPVFSGGRHNRPGGFSKDVEKYNEAAILGWILLRFTPNEIKNGKAIEYIRRVLEATAIMRELSRNGNVVFTSSGSTADETIGE